MERVIIYTKDNKIRLQLGGGSRLNPVKWNKGEQTKAIRGVNTVDISLESVNPIPFELGDRLTAFGEEYTLNLLPKARKTSENRFVYDLTFESAQYLLSMATFLDLDKTGRSSSAEFTIRCNLETIVALVVNNAVRVFGPGSWAIGSLPDQATEVRDFSFSGKCCLAVLQEICEEYGFDFRVSKGTSGHLINVGKFGKVLPLTLRYGRGKGLYNIARQNVSSSNIVTRLFAYGGTKNLPKDYRNYATRLRLPDIDGTNTSAVEDPKGVQAFGVVEGVKIFDEIFPHFTGIVSAKGADVNSFACNGMNFDLNEMGPDGKTAKYLIPGVSAKITFNSGGLSGYSFEVAKYDPASKTFTILPYTDPRGFTFPNKDVATYQIQPGDEFVITDVYPRSEDVVVAEENLLAEAKKYLEENSSPRVQYEITVAEEFLSKIAGNPGSSVNLIQPGDSVGIIDKDIQVERSGVNSIQITKFTRSLTAATPYSYKFTLSDIVETSIINRVIEDQEELDTIIRINQLTDPTRAQRSWKTTQELLSMIYDQDGFFKDGNIRPNSIETQMLSVGAKAQQMLLRDIVIEPNFGGNPNAVKVSNGTLVHYGLFDTPKSWAITGATMTLGSNAAYYIYARCNKADGNAIITFDAIQHKVEEGGYYYFILGVLHTVTDNTRWISLTFGATSINGRFIKTGRIVSADGSTWFDLDSGEIHGKITFGNSNTTLEEVNNKADSAKDYIDNLLPGVLGGITEQIDGKIDTYYSTGDPSVNWKTPAERTKHIGDLWYNTGTAELKRFSSSFAWEIIRNKDAIEALANAAKAQDTADGKRRVFVNTPVPPYDAGDLWANGKDLKRCIKGRLSGAYVANDWALATNYTGDESLNYFIENVYKLAIADIYNQLDGVVETWFGSGVPTLNNYPANSWATAQDKEKHLGDLYYNNDTGIGYRFSKSGSSYMWNEVRDTGVTEALAAAAKAQDTADGKRRVFVTQPTPPYDIGDLWTDGKDLRRCKVSRSSGSYIAGDWILATNYTGDENLNKFIEGTFAQSISDIKKQIDGKAEMYFSTSDPSGSWGTEERKKHVGDLWYNTGSNRLYRYTDLYKWEEIKNADAIAAAQAAAKAQDTADGKRRVFVNTPVPPYDVGDLWTNGKDLRRCKTARVSGTFTSSDWILATAYTGDENLNKFIDGVFKQTITDLVNQLDGKIESWFTNSDPASGWGSSEKPKHVGDLWYNTSTKILQRFSASFTWEKIEDAKAIAAAQAAAKAQDTADGKRRVFVNTPVPPYDVGDLWTNGIFLKRCITSRSSGSYVASDWGEATNYDNTKTTIDGGIVTSGTVQLAGAGGSILAGITGEGTAATSVRFWAGATFENRAKAPFRVQQNGEVFARRRIELQDEQGTGLAGICGSGEVSDNGVRFWAGSSFEGRSGAPFRVLKTGEVHMTKATIYDGARIGGFTVERGRLFWKARDYFGGDSRSLKLGVSGTDTEGIVDVSFNAATTGRFGIKAVGSNMGGAAIYASRNSSGFTYPDLNNTYAGYFDGGVHVNGNMYCDMILANEFGTGWTLSGGTYNYRKGVSGSLQWTIKDGYFQRRLHIEVANGIIVGLNSF